MDVVQVENLMSDLFTEGAQGREVLCHFAYPFEHGLVPYGRGIITLSLVV